MIPLRALIIGLWVAVIAPSDAYAFGCFKDRAVGINRGFLTGDGCYNSAENVAMNYVVGIVDGLFLAPAVGAPSDCVDKVYKCVKTKTGLQLSAIVKKYLGEHPEQWDESCNVLVYIALSEACEAYWSK